MTSLTPFCFSRSKDKGNGKNLRRRRSLKTFRRIVAGRLEGNRVIRVVCALKRMPPQKGRKGGLRPALVFSLRTRGGSGVQDVIGKKNVAARVVFGDPAVGLIDVVLGHIVAGARIVVEGNCDAARIGNGVGLYRDRIGRVQANRGLGGVDVIAGGFYIGAGTLKGEAVADLRNRIG